MPAEAVAAAAEEKKEMELQLARELEAELKSKSKEKKGARKAAASWKKQLARKPKPKEDVIVREGEEICLPLLQLLLAHPRIALTLDSCVCLPAFL